MMKAISFATLLACAAVLVGCETTDSAGGNQETKRRAAVARQQQREPVDEAHANLWHAHNDVIDRDNNPLRAY